MKQELAEKVFNSSMKFDIGCVPACVRGVYWVRVCVRGWVSGGCGCG